MNQISPQTWILDGSSLPYPAAYMQPFFPMPPGYNPYNPFCNSSKFQTIYSDTRHTFYSLI